MNRRRRSIAVAGAVPALAIVALGEKGEVIWRSAPIQLADE